MKLGNRFIGIFFSLFTTQISFAAPIQDQWGPFSSKQETKKQTKWVTPQVFINEGACEWIAWISPPPPPDINLNDTGQTCFPGILQRQRAYATTIAWGMQIWGWSWSLDFCTGSTGEASSSVSSGGASLLLVAKPDFCSPFIVVDWTPRFKLRTEITSTGYNFTKAAGSMVGTCPQVGVTASAAGAIAKATELTSAGNFCFNLPMGAGQVCIPFQLNTSFGPTEVPVADLKFGIAPVAEATVAFLGTVQVESRSDGNPFWYTAWAKSHVWACLPKLDLYGYCEGSQGGGGDGIFFCTGNAAVLYGYDDH